MKIKQILFSAITLLCFLGIALPVAAFDVEINKIKYSCNPEDMTAALKKGDKCKGDLEIPSTIEVEGKTYTVNSIKDHAFSFCKSLTSVNIPNSVTAIGDCAFEYSGLSSIIIPSSVTKLDGSAFYDTRLTSVLIEGVLKEVGDGPFRNCEFLKEIKFPSKQIADANKPVYKDLLLYDNSTTYGISTPEGSSSFSLPVPARLPMGAEKEYGQMQWRGDNLVNSAGKVVFNRAKYDDVLYQNAAIIVCKNGKWGAISYSGKVLAAPKYGRYEGYGRGNRLLFSNKTVSGQHCFVIAPTGAVLANRVFKNSQEYLLTAWLKDYMSIVLRD